MGIFDIFTKKKAPKDGIKCPYCGAYQDGSDNWVFSDKKKFQNWLVRDDCIKCHQDYWIIGSYEKATGSKRMGVY